MALAGVKKRRQNKKKVLRWRLKELTDGELRIQYVFIEL